MGNFSLDKLKETFEQGGLRNVIEQWTGTFEHADLLIQIVGAAVLTVGWLVFQSIIRHFLVRLEKQVDSWKGTRIRPLRIQSQEILSDDDVSRLAHRLVKGLGWLLSAVLLLVYLNILFSLFEWTRNMAVWLTDQLFTIVKTIGAGVIGFLPDLIVIFVIVFISSLLIKLIRVVSHGVASKRISMPGFYPEWASTTFSLMRLLVIALTVVVVFPYLPRSGSPAFQGVSIFFGLLLSLGSTSAVANVVAGIVITYTRAFVIGDSVRIAETEGEVLERSLFVTRIRTPKNVEVSIPNAAVLSSHIINYSAQAISRGLTLNTSVTIGYDVPWPKVHELLIQAAQNTDLIEQEPPPFVLQTALDDYYVAYELNATTRHPARKGWIYSDLHANILDRFRAANIDITSPHYRAFRDISDPASQAASRS